VKDWRERAGSFEGIAPYITFDLNLSGDRTPEPVHVTFASANLFDVLGMSPLIGRGFFPEEDAPGGDRYKAVLSHDLWRRRFAADPGVLGRSIRLDAETYTIIGVMPPNQRFPFQTDIWAPLDRWANYQNRASRQYAVIARMKRGFPIEQAGAEMERLSEVLEKENAVTNAGMRTRLRTLRESEVGNLKGFTALLGGGASLLLLIACANTSGLMLARAEAAAKGTAIRSALGASRIRIARLALSEAHALSICGGICGVALAFWGVQGLARVVPIELPFWLTIRIDFRVLAAALVITIFSGTITGAIAAFRSADLAVYSSLRERTDSSGMRLWPRRVLVVSEIALALVLVVAAGLMVRSLNLLQRVHPGFNPEQILTAHISVPYDKYPDLPTTTRLYDSILYRLQSLPGVISASGASAIPFSKPSPAPVTVENAVPRQQVELPHANWIRVHPSYLRTMQIPVTAGDDFGSIAAIDSPDVAPNVAIVSESLARVLWGDENPIGKRVKYGAANSKSPWRRVVAVAGDVRSASLDGQYGLDIYVPYSQLIVGAMTFVLRTEVEPQSLSTSVLHEIWKEDPEQAVSEITTMEQRLASSLWPRRVAVHLLMLFSAAALILAAIGIYGVMAFFISQRRQEFSIRLALGASRVQVIRLVLTEAFRLVLLGCSAGLVIALGSAQLLSALLYGIRPIDLWTFAAALVLLPAVAMSTTCLSAWSASRTDPSQSLRSGE
jgi:putative ABC transport system permease protein